MRDYKFRGKRIDNGEWVMGCYLETKMSGVYIIGTIIDGKKNREGIVMGDNLWQHEVDPKTVGQYTGYKDIYEGDKLHIEIHDHNTGKVIASGDCVVEYHNSSFGVKWGYHQDFTRFDGFGNTTFEVIGNIHDNPAEVPHE